MKKVLIITYYWPPSGGAGVQRCLKFVKYLREFGVEPIVITVDPNKASYPIRDESLLKEIPNDVRVIQTSSFEPLNILASVAGKEKIPHGGFANNNKDSIIQKTLRFVRGNFFIPDARKGWVRHAVFVASKLIEEEKIDTIFISSPPHSSQLIGLELKKKHNVRWIADLRDPWTDIYYYDDLLHTKFAKEMDAELERKVLEGADEIISVSQPINDTFLRKSDKLTPNKFHVTPNGFDESDFASSVKSNPSCFEIAYVGTIAANYRPAILLSSIRRLIKEMNLGRNTVSINMVGSSSSSVINLINENGLEHLTEFIGHVDHQSAVEFMQKADVLLLIIPDVPNNEGILTGKLFEYLACKKPIIGLGPSKGKAIEILHQCKAGNLFERNQEEELYEGLKKIYTDWKNGISFLVKEEEVKKYSRRVLTQQLVNLLK